MGRIRKRRTRPLGPPAASTFLHNTYVTPARDRVRRTSDRSLEKPRHADSSLSRDIGPSQAAASQ